MTGDVLGEQNITLIGKAVCMCVKPPYWKVGPVHIHNIIELSGIIFCCHHIHPHWYMCKLNHIKAEAVRSLLTCCRSVMEQSTVKLGL